MWADLKVGEDLKIKDSDFPKETALPLSPLPKSPALSALWAELWMRTVPSMFTDVPSFCSVLEMVEFLLSAIM